MKRGIKAVFVLMALACSAITHAKESELVTNSHGLLDTVSTMRVYGDLTFGPDGKVRDFHLTPPVEQSVFLYLKKVIESWEFEPVLMAGTRIEATTYFQITLAAREKDRDTFEVSVDNEFFYGSRSLQDVQKRAVNLGSDGKPKCVENCFTYMPREPRYPDELQRAGVNGAVMVHLYLNQDGTIADAIVAQSALYNARGNEKVLRDALKAMETESLVFARKLRAAPGSGSPLVGESHLSAAVLVIFQMNGTESDNLGSWRLEQRSKRNIAPWLAHDPKRWIGVSDAAGNGFISMKDSPYRLMSDPSATP